MTINCKYCETINRADRYFCDSCNQLLYSVNFTITKLIKEQENLKNRHLLELKLLDDKLKKVESYILKEESPEVLDHSIEVPQFEESIITVPQTIETNEFKAIQEEEVDESSPLNSHVSLYENQQDHNPIKESELGKYINQLFEPLIDGYDLIKQVFKRYKSEGKLPILLMTITGILAILVGFGHLMQLSFNYLGIYSGLVKVGLGFLGSLIIGFIGYRLYKRDSKYEEYSSALMSLMISLNYLLIYFLTNLSDFPFLSSAKIGFLLIVANTGLSIFLAFKYETKIIAILSLIGGALTPFYLNESGSPDYYFGYLWILLAAANFIAIRIKWYKLNYISFVLFLILVEGAVFTNVSESTLFIVYIHLFAYLFFYIILFNRTTLKSTLSQLDLIILSGNLSVLLYNLYDTLDSYLWLGILYLLNGILFMFILFRGWYSIPKQMKIGLFITIGSFVGLAIPFLFGQELIGVLWSIEAILLIVLGFVYSMESIRKEGYIILLIALGKLCLNANKILENWGEGLVNEGFLNYIVLGVVFSSLWYIGTRFKHHFTNLEFNIYSLFKEIIPLWLATIVFIVSFNIMGYYAFNIMILPLFGLIYWHFIFKTKSIEIFALLHIFVIGMAFVISTKLVHSFSFSDQMLFGKMAILEILFIFWFLQFFYEKMKYSNVIKHKVVYGLRVLFYVLLPLIFIKQVFKHAIPFFPIALWVSFLMSYGLFRKFKHYALLVETHLLLFISIGINIALYGINGLSIGLITLVTFLLLEKAYNTIKLEASNFLSVLILTPYIIIGLIGLILFKEGVDIAFSLFIIIVLLFTFTYFFNRLEIVYKSYRLCLKMILILSLPISLYYCMNSPSWVDLMYLMLMTGVSGYLLNISHSDYLENEKVHSWKLNIFIHQILIILTYINSILVMNLELDGPLVTIFIVIHAIVLLFMALKYQNKALNKGSLFLFVIALIKVIFHDIRDFSGTSKIIVLIVLGIILLIASFGYVKVKNKYMPTEIDNNEDHE